MQNEITRSSRQKRLLLDSVFTCVLVLSGWGWTQEKAPAEVSPEFAKAANLAFVAIRNSMHSSTGATDLAPDQTVQTAINHADAIAVSVTETSLMQEMKFLAIMRPLELGLYDLAITDANQNATKAALAELEQTNNCIAAWRKVLRYLSGDHPKECGRSQRK